MARVQMQQFQSSEELAVFFAACDAAEGTDEHEPDWEQHREAIARSRRLDVRVPADRRVDAYAGATRGLRAVESDPDTLDEVFRPGSA